MEHREHSEHGDHSVGVSLCALWALWALCCVCALSITARAQATPPPDVNPSTTLPMILRGVGLDQKLGAAVPLDLPFADEEGRAVRLRDYFTGKPVLLTLVYYECPMLCTQVLNGLVSALRVVSFDAGRDFTIVTVSFNPRETPDLARRKKQTYIEQYGREGSDRGWHFLTGQPPSIDVLTRAVGFRYMYDDSIRQYAHTTGLMVLTPDGRVSRYLYGIEYSPRDLRWALVEASQNRIGTPLDKLLLFCYHYDPVRGTYSMAILNAVRVAGLVTVVALGGFIVIMRRRGK